MRVGLDARLAGAGLGIARVLTALAQELPAHGIDVVWIGAEALAPETVSEVAATPGPGFAGLDSPRGRRLARSLKLDVTHFPGNTGWWSDGREPFVLTVQDFIWSRSIVRERTPRQLLGHAYLRLTVPRALRQAGAVGAPSVVAAEQLNARHGIAARVIPYGVDLTWAEAEPDRTRDVPYVVAFAGRDPRKATDVVLAAWRQVADTGVGLVLLAGAGLPSELEPEIRALSDSGRIEVLGYLEEADLAGIVAGSLALLYPSRDEGFGLPVVEAMAAGVPVVTGLAPVTLDVGGDAVLHLERTDPASSAAAAIRSLHDDPSLVASFAQRGRARAKRFSWAAAAGAYAELYALACRSQGAGEPL